MKTMGTIINKVLWLLVLLCLAACTSDEADTLTCDGEGRLSLSPITVEMNVINSPLTKGTPSNYTAPQPEALTYSITNTATSDTQNYTYSELMSSPVLAVGNYTLTASYGTETMGTSPYLYYSTPFTIQALQTTILPSISVPLACAIIRPSIAELLPHFQGEVQLSISDESGASIAVNNLTDYYVPSDKKYTLSISGVNQLGEDKTLQGSISQAVARTRYILTCTADVPVFTLPEQPDYNAWSYHIDFTPPSASNISYTAGLSTDRILNNLTYEYSADGGSTWQTFTGITLSGLTPSTTYTFRARLGAVYSTNQVTLTTEGAEPVPNGDFEDLVQTINISNMKDGGLYTHTATIFSKTYQNTTNIVVQEPIKWSSINSVTCNYTGASNKNSWFVIPSTFNTTINCTVTAPKDNGISGGWTKTPDMYSNLTAQNGNNAMVIRNVAWDLNGPEPAKDTSTKTSSYYYSNNQPSSIANRSAGELFLKENDTEGYSFVTRPSALHGYYKYANNVDANEKGTINVELLNGSTSIGHGSTTLGPQADYSSFTVYISYTVTNLKATRLKIKIKSSDASTIQTTSRGGKEQCSYGATLTIDNLTFTYD